MDDVKGLVKEFILDRFLPGEDPASLTDDTPLVTTAILDSLATVQLVAFLEERFNIRIAAYEASVDNLNTVASIAALVRSKG